MILFKQQVCSSILSHLISLGGLEWPLTDEVAMIRSIPRLHNCPSALLFCTILVEGSSMVYATEAGDTSGWYHMLSKCLWSWRRPTASVDESPCNEGTNSLRQGVYKVFTHMARLNNSSLAWYSRNQLWNKDQNSSKIQGLSLQGFRRSRKTHLGK